MAGSVTVSGAGSSEVNGTYVYRIGTHENRHFSTIAGHYQHTQNPEIFIAFQDCGTNHQRPEWNKWMIISKVGVLYAAHTGGKIGVPPREGVWENVEGWGHPGAPGGKHPAPTVRHGEQASKAATKIQKHIKTSRSSTSASNEPIQVLEAVSGKPVRFKLNNPPNHNEAWVGIYPTGASDQEHGAHNQRWKYIRDLDVNNVSFPNQAEGDWSIRLFSDGGYTLVERKEFPIRSAHGTRSTNSTFPSDVGVTHCKPGPRLTYADSEAYAAKMEGRLLTLDEAKALMGGEALYPGEDQWCAVHGRDWVQVGDLHHHPGKSHNRECGGYPPWGDDANNTTYGNSTWNYVALYKAADGTSPKPTISLSSTGQKQSIEILEAVTGKPVRFKIKNPPTSHDAWVGIYPPNASDQDHGAENNRWKWLRNIDVNNVSFPKRATGPWSIRVFSNGGHALHERKDFDVKPPEPRDPAEIQSTRGSAKIALAIGVLLLMPGIPLLIFGIGQGLSDGMTSATLEIKDGDEQGDLGWGIYIEGSLVDYNSNGIYDHCENIFVSAIHSGSWMSDPWTGYQKVNPPDESRQVFEDYCGHTDPVEQRYHDGRDLIKIGTACYGCMAGTTTITAQNTDGGEVVMWIQNEEKKETLGMLIPGAIIMGIGGFTFVMALVTLLNMGFKSNAPSSSKRRAGTAMGVGITLFSMGLPLLIIGFTSTGGDKIAMLAPGAVLFGIGAFILFISMAVVIRMGSVERHSSVAGTGAAGSASTSLEVLSFNHRQPVRFSITDPPQNNDAWVGLYPASADDRDHGERWHYLRDIDVSNASLPGQEQGAWSLRLFSDGGYTLHQRVEFELRESSKMEVWMKEAEFEDQEINGLVQDHRNRFTKLITTDKIRNQEKVGNINRFETDDTTYLIYDRDLQVAASEKGSFWETI